MKATAPTLRWRNFARAEATRAWIEATKRQALNTNDDDSLSDTNSLNSLSDDNSLDSDSDAGRQQPPQTTNPPQLTGAAKTRQRLTAGSRSRVTRRSLEQRQAINTSDDESVDSLDNSLDSADSSADEARPLPTSTTTRRPNLNSKTRARLASKHRRALDARQALDSDSADSVNDSLDSGAESSADEARPLGRPTRTQKRRTRRTINARQALDNSADDKNSLDSLDSGLSDGNSTANEARPTLAPTNPPIFAPKNRNRLTFGQRQQHKAAIRRSIAARQNNLQDPTTSDSNSLSDDNSLSSLSDNNSLDSNSVDSASDSDAARPQPTNPANLTSKAPKRLGTGADASSRPARISRREIPGKRNTPAEHPEHPEEEEEDAASVSSVSSGDSDDEMKKEEEKDETEKEKTKTSTVTAAPTATATGSAAATTTATVDGSATATITSTSGPSATSEPEDALAPVNSGDATALPNLSLAPAATATPSSVLGAIDDQPQADTQGQQAPVPTAKKMSAGATAGIVIGVLGMSPFPLAPFPFSSLIQLKILTPQKASLPSSPAPSSSS